MPDRRRPPRIAPVEALRLPPPERFELANGIPVYVVRSGQREVFKLELVLRAGRQVEHKPLVAGVTLRMLREGTRRRDAASLAEAFDHYGSSLRLPFNLDTAQIKVYSLARHVGRVLPVLAEMLAEPAFPERELHDHVQRRKRRLAIDLGKADVVAYRQFTEYIYGADHPFGYNSSAAAYDALTTADLRRHFAEHYCSGNAFVVVSGAADDAILRALDEHLGQAIRRGPLTDRAPQGLDTPPQKVGLPLPGAGQTAIRVGRRLFSRRHPDYEGVNVLAHALGGYFGSRLMANVREDKGYTYNIYAMTDPLAHDGAFYVATEVGNEAAAATLREIYREMRRLREEPMAPGELDMLRSYMLGGYLSALDGPFNQADVVRNLIADGLDLGGFDRAVEELRAMRPARLQELAQAYLDPASMWEVVVGPSLPG